jgi:hypothetical protein
MELLELENLTSSNNHSTTEYEFSLSKSKHFTAKRAGQKSNLFKNISSSYL